MFFPHWDIEISYIGNIWWLFTVVNMYWYFKEPTITTTHLSPEYNLLD